MPPQAAGKKSQRQRMTKAQLIDELEKLESGIAAGKSRLETDDVPERSHGSQNLFRTVVDSLPMGISLKDKQGKLVLVNKQLQEWWGEIRSRRARQNDW